MVFAEGGIRVALGLAFRMLHFQAVANNIIQGRLSGLFHIGVEWCFHCWFCLMRVSGVFSVSQGFQQLQRLVG